MRHILRNYTGESILNRTTSALKALVFGVGFLLPAVGFAAGDCGTSVQCTGDLADILRAEEQANPAASRGLLQKNPPFSISVDGETIVGSPLSSDTSRTVDNCWNRSTYR